MVEKNQKFEEDKPRSLSENEPIQLSLFLTLEGFETPFYNQLDPTNRWIVLSRQIPWDDLVSLYNKHNPPKQTGRPSLNPRVLIGAVIIKHILKCG